MKIDEGVNRKINAEMRQMLNFKAIQNFSLGFIASNYSLRTKIERKDSHEELVILEN